MVNRYQYVNFLFVILFLTITCPVHADGNGRTIGKALLESFGEASQTAKKNELDQYANDLAIERDAGRMTSVQRSRLMRQKSQEIYGAHDNDLKEYWDYHEYIAYRMDTQGLSQQEATYLMQQKENEINARFEARNQAPAAAAPLPRKNLEPQCFSECTQRLYSYPYCESKCSY